MGRQVVTAGKVSLFLFLATVCGSWLGVAHSGALVTGVGDLDRGLQEMESPWEEEGSEDVLDEYYGDTADDDDFEEQAAAFAEQAADLADQEAASSARQRLLAFGLHRMAPAIGLEGAPLQVRVLVEQAATGKLAIPQEDDSWDTATGELQQMFELAQTKEHDPAAYRRALAGMVCTKSSVGRCNPPCVEEGGGRCLLASATGPRGLARTFPRPALKAKHPPGKPKANPKRPPGKTPPAKRPLGKGPGGISIRGQSFGSGGGKIGCFKRSYGRGVGKISLNCNWMKDSEQDAGLCYPKCPPGFKGIGPVCWKGIIPKGRGVGQVMKPDCGKGENNAGLCYDKCAPGTVGVGPVCWGNCGGAYPEACGAFCTKRGKCAYATSRMGQQAFNVLKTAFNAGKCAAGAVATAGAAVPLCAVETVQGAVSAGKDLKTFFADEMDGVCR